MICKFLPLSDGVPLLAAIMLSPIDAAEPTAIEAANAELGRGINLGNFLEAPRDASWGEEIRPEHLRLIARAGFDSIRFPVRWSDYAAGAAPYRVEEPFFKRVDRYLDAAHQANLNVVLNMHHYERLSADPEMHRERFAAIWRQIAERYQQRGQWLYFELNNEPVGKLNDQWNSVMLDALSSVRTTNPTRPVIIGPPFWNGIWALPKLELPDDPNLIVTVHMYNPHEFTHQGASWVEDRIRQIRDRPWGSSEEKRELRAELEMAAEWAAKHKRPLYLGEFGAYQAAPMESRIAWTRAVVEVAEELGMSWAYWEFSSGFGAYDPQAKQWRKPILNALIR